MNQPAAGSPSRRILKGSGWLFGGQTLATVLALVQGVLLARLLGPESYGIVALVTTFTALLTRFFDARSWETAVKYLTEFILKGESGQARAVLKGLVGVDLIAAALTWGTLFALAPLGARVFVQDPAAAGLIRVYALTVLGLAPFGIGLALLMIANRYAWMSGLQAACALAELALTLGVVLWGGSLRHLMWAFVAAAGVRTLGALWVMARVSPSLGLSGWLGADVRDARERIREVVQFWASSNLFAVIKGIHQSVDTLLVGSFLGPAPAGLFRVAKNLSQGVAFPLTPLFQTSYPELVRLHGGGDGKGLRALYRRLLGLGGAAALGIAAVVWLLAPLLVHWTAGPEYASAATTLRWLALGVALTAATQFGHALLMSMGRLKSVFLSFATPLALQIVLLVVLLPVYGQEAAGWAFLGFAALRGIQLVTSSARALDASPIPEQT